MLIVRQHCKDFDDLCHPEGSTKVIQVLLSAQIGARGSRSAVQAEGYSFILSHLTDSVGICSDSSCNLHCNRV